MFIWYFEIQINWMAFRKRYSTGVYMLYQASMTWWRHQMETFSAILALCAGNPPVTGEFPTQRPVTWSFDVFFDLHLNKRLSKQSWGWLFEMPSRSLWRHCNEFSLLCIPSPNSVIIEIVNGLVPSKLPSIILTSGSIQPLLFPIKRCCGRLYHVMTLLRIWTSPFGADSCSVTQWLLGALGMASGQIIPIFQPRAEQC